MTKTTKIILVLAGVGVVYYLWKKHNSSTSTTSTAAAAAPATTTSTSTTASFSGYPAAKEAKFANASGRRFQ